MADLTQVKKGENFIVFEDKSGNKLIRIDKVRFSYAFLGQKREEENDDGGKSFSNSVTAMLPKATHLAAKDAVKEIIADLCTKNKFQVPMDKWFMADGDKKINSKDGSKDEIAAGHWLITCRDSKNRPKARNARMEIIDDLDEVDRIFYSGSWGHILVRPWFFDGKAKNSKKTFPKRVSAGVNAVIFWKDDKAFGAGRVDDSDAWGDLPPSEGADNGIDSATAGADDM